MDFEWDDDKAASNVLKHGVRFELATVVFLDPDRLDVDATRTLDGEVRRKTVGAVEGRLLTVVYTERQGVVRLISARRSSTKEARLYGPVST
jgi:uncharacterized protein